jgi:hypothetical protein
VEIFKNEINRLEEGYNKYELKYFHFNSIKNFIKYFDSIRYAKDKNDIKELMGEYFNAIRSEDLITKEISQQFYLDYIERIAQYYVSQLDFKRMPRLSGMLFIGMTLDCFLLIVGALRLISYIPIFTIIGVSHYFHIYVTHKKINKVYGYKF